MPPIECPKCHGRMEEGFIKDEGHGYIYTSKWVEGAPETSFWSGTKTSGKEQIHITSYRCEACGYLESYAK
jgi:hypothetical protein